MKLKICKNERFVFYIMTTVVHTENYELKKSRKSTVNVSKYRSLCIEIFKTLNDINYSFIKDIFKLRMTNRPTREKSTESRNSKVE